MDESLTRNAADRADVRRADQKVKDREKALLAALATVMQTPAGRHVLGEWIESANVWDRGFNHSGSAVYFRDGRCEYVVEWMRRMIAASPSLWELLERERRARVENERIENRAAHTSHAVTQEDDQP